MALTGTLKSTDYQGRYVEFSWSATQNIAKNQSTISWTLKGAGDASSSWYNAAPFYVNVAGTEKTSSTRIKLYKGTEVMSGTKTITHNSDGKATFTVSIKAAIYAASYNCSGSTTFTLNTIPRKATITSAPNEFSDEDTLTVNYSNPANGSLQIGIYKTDGSTALVGYRAASGSSYKFTFTAAEKTALQNACTTANSMSVRIYLRTTIDGNNYHNYVTKTLKIVNANPVIVPTAIEEQDDNGFNNTTATGSNMRWIKGYTDIAYQFNEVVFKGATVKSYSVTCGTKTGNTASGVLYNIENKDVVFTLIDSRGNKATKTVSGTLVNYIKPTVSLGVKAALETETTAKFTLDISGNFFNGNIKTSGGNALTLQYRYKTNNGSYGAWTALTPSKSGNKYSVSYDITGLDYQKTYTFQARVQDAFYLAHNSWIYSGEIAASAKPVFQWNKEEFDFNCDVNINGNLALNNKWVNLTIANGFKLYNDNAKAQPKYKVCGSVVTVTGALSPSAAITSNATPMTIATGIPSEYCPQYTQYAICQGSGMAHWLLSVDTDGKLTMARYGTATALTDTTVGAGTWLPFTLTYQF